uniref:ATP synthase F0 subunit 6 n=1 Tax=Macroscytus japonensis TaxID=763219 RepID=UPI0023D8695F|nr:ATP synthase F0 subunit 6 [Macroscytus japonensis]WCS41488.1 ATP synthase F0 subunit 6 [Macroscytus japonensis]
MMTNLFSTFDPSTSINVSMNWLSTFLGLMILPLPYWVSNNRFHYLINKIMNILHNEFNTLLSYKTKGMTLIMVSLFMFILMNNMMGLMPYIFTSSSHLTFTMTMALPLWLSIMIFGWVNHTNHMFMHLVPMGTPSVLMPFMVMIETISNLIRPGSLAVRLTANMIAGHLLMSLLGNNSVEVNNMILPFIVLIQIMLMLFETAVAAIQAYVFSVLSTLYASEVI